MPQRKKDGHLNNNVSELGDTNNDNDDQRIKFDQKSSLESLAQGVRKEFKVF